MILALEGSTLRASVALVGDEVRRWSADGPGTAAMGAVVARLLEEAGAAVADLDGIVVGVGPGSYTGVRSSVALARGLALGAALPLAGVPSVAAAALGALREHGDADAVTVLVEARRGQLYRADYRRDGDGIVETAGPRLVPAGEQTSGLVVRDPVPDPYDVAVLGGARLAGGGDDPATVVPLYLKRSHAEITWQEKRDRERRSSGLG